MAVRIKNSKNFEDEVLREKHLQTIEAVATTDQLDKLAKLASNPEMIAVLDSFEL